MAYVPFYEKFPEVAAQETRRLFTFNFSGLPEDEYLLIESYCDEPGCDCRRVMFNVYAQQREDMVAVIAYGWGSERHYVKWYGQNDPRMIQEMQGPVLNSMSRQSELAPELLKMVTMILEDGGYVKRLKRHYKMFREVVENEAMEDETAEDETAEWDEAPAKVSRKKYPRNAPCPCGSGKKYKHCCGKAR